MENTPERPIMDSRYNYLLLNKDYKEDLNQILFEFANKDYQNLNFYIDNLLTDLEQINPHAKSDYFKYYNQYNQVLLFEVFLNSHKNLAFRILQGLKNKIQSKTITQTDLLPFLNYIIFKKHSCYFRKYWFCLPYLRYSNNLYEKNKVDIDSYLSFDNNFNNIYQLLPNPYVNEEEIFFSIDKRMAEKILNNMPIIANTPDIEEYSFNNILMKSKTEEYLLVYTILD